MTSTAIFLLITLGFGGLLALSLSVLLGSSFLMAMLHVPEHAPLQRAPEHAEFTSTLGRKNIEKASQLGFQRIAAIETDESRQQNEPTCVVMLSEDRLVLMLVSAQAKLMGYSLYSQMANGHWLQTEQKLDDPGMSPYYVTAQLDSATPTQLLACHLDRVVQAPLPCVPFDPAAVLDDLYTQETKHVEHLIAHGLGKWANPSKTAWRMTLRGAMRYAWLCATTPMRKESLERHKKYVQDR